MRQRRECCEGDEEIGIDLGDQYRWTRWNHLGKGLSGMEHDESKSAQSPWLRALSYSLTHRLQSAFSRS